MLGATEQPPSLPGDANEDSINIDKLIASIKKYPWFYYEVFINPNFMTDIESAKSVGAKIDSDTNLIKEYYEQSDNKFHVKLTDAFIEPQKIKKEDGSIGQILMPNNELKALRNILNEHLSINLKKKELTARFESKTINNINFKEEGLRNNLLRFQKEYPEAFKTAFADILTTNEEVFLKIKKNIEKKPVNASSSNSTITKYRFNNIKSTNSAVDLNGWLNDINIPAGTYQDSLLLNTEIDIRSKKPVVDSENNIRTVGNKINSIQDLQNSLQKSDIKDGSLIIVELEKEYFQLSEENDQPKALLVQSLLEVAKKTMIKKLADIKGINEINFKEYIALSAELEIIPFKDMLLQDANAFAKYEEAINAKIMQIKNQIRDSQELPKLELLSKEQKLEWEKKINISHARQEQINELDLLKLNKNIKEQILKPTDKKEAYNRYMEYANNSSLNESLMNKRLMKLNAMREHLNDLKMQNNNKRPGLR